MKTVAYKIIVLLSAILLWYVIHYYNVFLVPTPLAVLITLPELLMDKKVLIDIQSTLLRVLGAFALSVVAAVPIGLFLGKFKKIYFSVSYLIDFFRSTPATAIFPIFLLVFGIGDQSKIFSAAFASFLIIIFNLAEGILHISKSKLLAIQAMGASEMQTIQKVIFWESLPHLFIGLRNGISTSMIVIIVTEMFVGTLTGIGKRIVDFQITYEIPSMYAMIFIIGLLGYGINQLIFLAESRVVHWYQR